MIRQRLRPLASQAKRTYVQLMMDVVGRSLEAISEVDDQVRNEAAVLPDGFLFSMQVMPKGPALFIRKQRDGSLQYLGGNVDQRADLSIQFKHLHHAFLVLSFQEKTAQSFANDRMVVDGDLGYAVRMTRVLNRLETFILPRLVASRAVKEYPDNLGLPEKVFSAARIYLKVAMNFVDTVRSS
ncbi:hypothetical protein [Salicola sp. Rm-C-2C1-2]|uniref:hypothetical protein n=1 Tax=Salicola sp. Rm-C-2C1-2 TaxID=3141321 RepID=UPI0032E4E17D